jgi:hypothetical protein
MSSKSERKVTSPAIPAEERSELTHGMVGIAETLLQQDDISKAENLKDIQHHIGLIAMTAGLNLGNRVRQVAHIRKMLAHEYVTLPRNEKKARGEDRLLKAAREAAGPEISEARRFKGDVDSMPQPYRLALEDRDMFHEELTTDPMIIKLRRSIDEARQRRQS